MDSRSVMPLLLREGRLDCPAPRRSARPLRAGEVGYHGVHDAPISAFMMPRSVFTMLRSGCSRSPDPGVQDGPKPALKHRPSFGLVLAHLDHEVRRVLALQHPHGTRALR